MDFYVIEAVELDSRESHIEKCLLVQCRLDVNDDVTCSEQYEVWDRLDVYEEIAEGEEKEPTNVFAFNILFPDTSFAKVVCYNGDEKYITTVADESLCNNLRKITIDDVSIFDGKDINTYEPDVLRKLRFSRIKRAVKIFAKK